MNAVTLRSLLLVALPYASVVAFVAGLVWRYRSRMSISSLSSQMLESRWLAWGAVPFHLGTALLLLGHLLPVLVPDSWQALVSNYARLIAVESIEYFGAVLCLAGLAVLFVRRASLSVLRSSSTVADLVVLLLLIAQVGTGLAVATLYRWGAVWSVRTVTPYLWSIVTLRPDPEYLGGIPWLLTLHLSGAWLILALVPYTRLVHMFSLPLGYAVRRPQKVVWLADGRKPAAGR